MTIVPPGRPQPRRAPTARRGVWVVSVIVVVVLAIVGVGGVRTWWAHRVHDMTGGSWPADFALGLVVGLLPIVGVGVGGLGATGSRRVVRMVALGALGFVVTLLLSPSISTYIAHPDTTRVFRHDAPGYLPGVATAQALWLVALVIAFARLRRWRRALFRR